MAGLQRHPSLRFSVFELAKDIGLEATAFDGKFDAIIEEDEQTVCPLHSRCYTCIENAYNCRRSQLQTSPTKQQRRTHSSDELTDSPFPFTPPSSNIVS